MVTLTQQDIEDEVNDTLNYESWSKVELREMFQDKLSKPWKAAWGVRRLGPRELASLNTMTKQELWKAVDPPTRGLVNSTFEERKAMGLSWDSFEQAEEDAWDQVRGESSINDPDPNLGNIYYFNPETGAVSPHVWRKYKAPNNQVYYVNSEHGETLWASCLPYDGRPLSGVVGFFRDGKNTQKVIP